MSLGRYVTLITCFVNRVTMLTERPGSVHCTAKLAPSSIGGGRYGKEDLSPGELRVLATPVERVDGRRDVTPLRHQGRHPGRPWRQFGARPAHGGLRRRRRSGNGHGW